MTLAAVESTLLAAVAYDASNQMLELEFRDRAIYQYFGVPAEIHDALLRAPSKGHYFNRVIRGKFRYASSQHNRADNLNALGQKASLS
jgi:hypothetical protein